jgi:hypothetical protein
VKRNIDKKKLNLELTRFNDEMTQVLISLDLVAARKFMTSELTDEIILVALHRARVHATSVEKYLRLESLEWLRAHGISDMYGAPLPPPGTLPM